ncbi:MAG: N-acetylmuramoyl-L-alanine amidase [Gloeomargaritaceae cyanobacterium C42_A2020_066]|nr:N-acetylmuramoyl-L-alanine amidase [Gloeomargaritaceae cyanobacterium C42_A2020_066]
MRRRRWVWVGAVVFLLVSLMASQSFSLNQEGTVVVLEPAPVTDPAGPGFCPLPARGQSSIPLDFQPPQEVRPAHPSNYGQRQMLDAFGRPVVQSPIVVLHETVGTADNALNLFEVDHTGNDNAQVSYHAIIRLDGTVVYIVPPTMRAFGASPSQFRGQAVRTNPRGYASVNNFAYHISLETPEDGRNNANFHSGYTAAQYQSLVWLVAQTCIPLERITTHRAVDTSGSRKDPRSFDWARFNDDYLRYPKRRTLYFGLGEA